MVQNYDGIAISQLVIGSHVRKIYQRFSQRLTVFVTHLPIIPQHKLDQTKEHVL